MGNLAYLLLDVTGKEFITGLLNVISLVMTAVAAAGVFYAFFLFYLMATASNEDKRRAAKSRIVNVVSSLLIIIALVALLIGIKDTINFTRVPGGNGSSNNDELNNYTDYEIVITLPKLTLNGTHFTSRASTEEEKKCFNWALAPGSSTTGDTLIDTLLSGTVTITTDDFKLTPKNALDDDVEVKVEKITNFEPLSSKDFFEKKYWQSFPVGNGLKIDYLCCYKLTPFWRKVTVKGDGKTAENAIYVNTKVTFLYSLSKGNSKVERDMTIGVELILTVTEATKNVITLKS